MALKAEDWQAGCPAYCPVQASEMTCAHDGEDLVLHLLVPFLCPSDPGFEVIDKGIKDGNINQGQEG